MTQPAEQIPLPHGQPRPPSDGTGRGTSLPIPVGWIAKQIILPLAPFVIVAILRAVLSGLSWSVLDPGEIFFSLAMLFSLVLVGAGRLQDVELRDALTSLFTLAMATFIAFFAVASVLKLQSEECMAQSIEHLRQLTTNSPEKVSQILKGLGQHEKALGTLRILAIVSLVLSPLVVVGCRRRYKLTD